jgi:hypothetical protein
MVGALVELGRHTAEIAVEIPAFDRRLQLAPGDRHERGEAAKAKSS